MSSSLKGLFGGGEAADHDFVQRVTTGNPSEGFTTAEAQKHLRKVLKRATPDQIQRATKQAVANLPEDQRAEFAQMLQDRQAGRAGVQIQRTGGSSGGTAAAPNLDDLLGGLLGGAQTGGGSSGGTGGGGILGMLMSLLSSLFGGGSRGRSTGTSGATAGGGDLFGSLGDLINTPAGKAVIGGIAAYATKEMMENKR